MNIFHVVTMDVRDHYELGTNLAGVLPVHGIDGRAGVHVHEVVVVVASHDSPTSVMELHGESSRVLDTHTRGMYGVWGVTAPASYLDCDLHPAGWPQYPQLESSVSV